MKSISGGITAPKGFKAAGVKAGIKKSGKEDLALIYSTVPAAVAAMFTTNTMAAAPVVVSRQVAAKGSAQAIVVNSGCANASTGEQGILDARAMAYITSSLLGLSVDEVLVASTGIIGPTLPMGKVADGIKLAAQELSETGSDKAAQAIMTTDTFAKTCSHEFELDGVAVRIGGIAKGVGMIHPNMATALCFITTDAAVAPAMLNQALHEAVETSFHSITVDGDTSTNDMVCVLANGQAGNNNIVDAAGASYGQFAAALKEVCVYLAQQLVRDGEGATKFLTINVCGAASLGDAKAAAMAVAKSPLVKTAFFGEDPNWGRILGAVGYSGAKVVQDKVKLTLGGVLVVDKGVGVRNDGKALQKVMAAKDIEVVIDLSVGDGAATVWTSDLSYEYVKINADYHT
jgi:glutamate N-acetyltransferase / amino-acid N-acetyltransferase